jgi:hypothetical protein
MGPGYAQCCLLIIFNMFEDAVLNSLYFLGEMFNVKCIVRETEPNFHTSIY